MRKLVAFFLVAAMVLGTASYWTGNAKASAPAASQEAVTIQVCITDDREQWMNTVIEAYKLVKPNVTVKVEVVSGNASDKQTKMTMMMQSPLTCPDIIQEDGFKITVDAAAGYLSPLDQYIAAWPDAENFYANVMEMGRSFTDGKMYGIPFVVDVLGLWYDKLLLAEAGVPVPFEPKTWEEVLDAARKIKALGRDEVIPYFITTAKTFPERASMRLFQPLYNGTGHDIYDTENNKWSINKQAFLDVCNYVNTICNGEQLAPPLDLGVQNQVETILQSEMMKKHQVGIWLSGNWMCQNWAAGQAYEWPNVTDEVGFARIPTQFGQEPHFTSMSGGWTFAIPENADQKDAAWEFMTFALNRENLLKHALIVSALTVRKDVAQEAAYSDPARLYIAEASDILNYTHFRPALELYSQVSLLCTEAMESIGMNAATPEAAYDTFVKALQAIVGAENLVLD